MRAVIQRVGSARVEVNGDIVGSIGAGLLVLIGISSSDTREDACYLSDKILGLRIFPDDDGRMNRNIAEAGGSLLLISQFTLYGDCRKGRRPSFDRAAPAAQAQALYNHFVDTMKLGAVPVQTGIFQAVMDVHLVNQGPVTLILDSADRTRHDRDL